MSDTIFYTLKLKRTRTPDEVFAKMAKAIKKKGPTKNWVYTIDNEREAMAIEFMDEKSETFSLHFENKTCSGFCKVFFPLDGELFEDESKSEFKALINMIYAARTSFSVMDISDDYGLATDFLESKKYKLSLKELTPEQTEHVKTKFDAGVKKHTKFILSEIYDGLEIPYTEGFSKYVNRRLAFAENNLKHERTKLWPFFKTYIYETSEYKDQGRAKRHPEYNEDFSGIWFSTQSFVLMMDELYRFQEYTGLPMGVKHAQLRRLYMDKVYPELLRSEDDFEKCRLAYSFFLAAYEFCGFKFVGKEKKNPVSEKATDNNV